MIPDLDVCRWCGGVRDPEPHLLIDEEVKACDCFLCESCHEYLPFEQVVKLSPGEFKCHDCLNQEADYIRERLRDSYAQM